MQLFSADAIVFSKKKKKYDPENVKNPPSKVAHNRPPTFFYVLARLPKEAKTEITYHQKPFNVGLRIQTGVFTMLYICIVQTAKR
jgi:hypothetical protein